MRNWGVLAGLRADQSQARKGLSRRGSIRGRAEDSRRLNLPYVPQRILNVRSQVVPVISYPSQALWRDGLVLLRANGSLHVCSPFRINCDVSCCEYPAGKKKHRQGSGFQKWGNVTVQDRCLGDRSLIHPQSIFWNTSCVPSSWIPAFLHLAGISWAPVMASYHSRHRGESGEQCEQSPSLLEGGGQKMSKWTNKGDDFRTWWVLQRK